MTHAPGQAEAFLEQAAHCDGRSPLYARLCRRLADEPRASALVDEWRWDTPLRLLGGVHYLVLAGSASWDHVEDALDEHAPFLRRFVREQPVQTNEVQRCWVLLPCFLEVAREAGAETLDLIELGPSAGLNLVWDRYRYTYAAGDWGPADAPLSLTGAERQRAPGALLAIRPRVRGRVGIDRAPVDATTEEGARLLESFVWADQRERLERLDQAISALRRDPPELRRGDFVELLPGCLERRRPDAITVVFQTAALGYVGPDERAFLRETLDTAGRDGGLAFVSAGRPRRGERVWGLRRIVWPGARRRFLAHADYHGSWLDWTPE